MNDLLKTENLVTKNGKMEYNENNIHPNRMVNYLWDVSISIWSSVCIMSLSNRKKKEIGSWFAGNYGVSYKDVDFFVKHYIAENEKQLKNALYIRFCIDSFADKEFPKEIYEKLWEINEKSFGLPPGLVYVTYKELAESLCKQDDSCNFRDWNNPNSELHQCCEAHIYGILQRKKSEHWKETKEKVHKELYNRPLIE